DRIAQVWNGIIKPSFEGWKIILGTLGDAFKGMWENFIKPAWDALQTGLDAGWKLIEKGINAGITVFEKLRDAVKTVFDFITNAWDKVSGIIDKAGDFVGSVGGAVGSVLPGHANGGWTGPGSKYQPAGIVHADEFVVQKSSRRKFEKQNP